MKIVTRNPVYFTREDFVPEKHLDEKCDITGIKFFTPVIPYTTITRAKCGKCVRCIIKARFLETDRKIGRKDTLITLPKGTPILTPDYTEFTSLSEAVQALGSFNLNTISEDYNLSFVFGDLVPDLDNLVRDLYKQGFYPSITLGKNLKSHIKALK